VTYGVIAEKLSRGELILLDGATGTELERRGVPMNDAAWCGPSVLEHGVVLQEIHEEYVRLGCDVITANTFASGPGMLRAAGMADAHGAAIDEAVAIARRAITSCGREDSVALAGSMSHMIPVLPGTDAVDPDLGDIPDGFEDDCVRHAETLHATGVDMILLEMMYHPQRSAIAKEAACATGLPIWFGLSVREGSNGGPILFDQHSERSISELFPLLDERVDVVSIMHSRADLLEPTIEELRAHWRGPIAVYPDSGHFEMPKWNFAEVMSPHEFSEYGTIWRGLGCAAIGGCCGLGPSHLAEFGSSIRNR
jgi:S-methylmethionine-dependent homocysteine/selenocysteine methylase